MAEALPVAPAGRAAVDTEGRRKLAASVTVITMTPRPSGAAVDKLAAAPVKAR